LVEKLISFDAYDLDTALELLLQAQNVFEVIKLVEGNV